MKKLAYRFLILVALVGTASLYSCGNDDLENAKLTHDAQLINKNDSTTSQGDGGTDDQTMDDE